MSQDQVEKKQSREGGQSLTQTKMVLCSLEVANWETAGDELPRAGATPRPVCPNSTFWISPQQRNEAPMPQGPGRSV